MHCWVNKGAKGIALIDEDNAHGKRLKYVFDVSDVHAARRIGRYPEKWEVHEEHKDAVIDRLEQIYGGTDERSPFEERLIEISRRIAEDCYEELLPDLQYLTEGSFLEGLDNRILASASGKHWQIAFRLLYYQPAVRISWSTNSS